MIVTIAALLAAAPITLLLLIYTAEVTAGLRMPRSVVDWGVVPRTTVLVPAHNEGAGIDAMLAALSIPSGAPIDVLVIADNCSDDTAARARDAGARVVERFDPVRRGKGFALDFGRRALAADPPECVVVLDADCMVEGNGLQRLVRRCVAAGRPVQSCYLLRGDLRAPVTVQVSNFAFLMKNLVRQRGMARLGGVAALTGSGMALLWTTFAATPLASDDIVEDLALGIWLTRHGSPPSFAPDIVTWSDPAHGGDLLVQRSRWEHGFVATARRRALPLIGAGLAGGGRATLWLGLHLLVPPLALLFVIGGGMLGMLALATISGEQWWPLAILAGALAAASAVTLVAWWCVGRTMVSARALFQVPRYIMAKLPIYAGLFGRGPKNWVRTRRVGEKRGEDA